LLTVFVADKQWRERLFVGVCFVFVPIFPLFVCFDEDFLGVFEGFYMGFL
jgi:hypothetical protein